MAGLLLTKHDTGPSAEKAASGSSNNNSHNNDIDNDNNNNKAGRRRDGLFRWKNLHKSVHFTIVITTTSLSHTFD
jgi:hypothetical protein